MKKTAIFLLFIAILAGCNNKKNTPDVSGISVDLAVERFDKDFFAIDSNNLLTGLNRLNEKYPLLTSIFLENILGLDSASTLPGVKQFLQQSQGLYDSVNEVFSSTSSLENDFREAFRFVKYYFPQYKAPKKIITVVGPVDALAQSNTGYTPNFLTPGFLGISLQFYLGRQFSVYNDPYFISKVAPAFRSRRFSKEYIIADGMQLIVDDLFPAKNGGKPLIDQMIERGKQWWLLDQFLPAIPDSVKTGYTENQLQWCKANEGLIWSFIIKNEDLRSVNPSTIQVYIGESPYTQSFSPEQSPGNIGQWIGWQIVKKFAGNHSGMKPEEVMNTPATKILDDAKYRPK
jgi:hypothetical protein